MLGAGTWRLESRPGEGPAVGLLGKLNGSSLVLFRLERQRRQSKPLTLLLTCLDTALPTFLQWVQVAWHHRWEGGRSWNCGAPGGGLANHTRGLITFQDLQDKTNGTVKKKKKKIKPEPQSALRLMTISVCGLGLKAGTPNLPFWSLTHGADTLPGIFSQLGLQTAVTQDFPALFESGYQSKPNLMIYGLLLLFTVLFLFFFFNDCLL